MPLPQEQRLFRPKEFFEKHGISFYDKTTTLETKTSLQILFPFDSLVNFPNMDDGERKKLLDQVNEARNNNKTIVAVSHGEPNWQIHNLTVPNAVATGEHAQVIKGFTQALGLLLPDEIIYGHMHDLLTDEAKNKLDENTKYALQVNGQGEVELVDDPDKFTPESMLSSYLPMRRIAELKVPRAKNKKIEGFGGFRQPAKVKNS